MFNVTENTDTIMTIEVTLPEGHTTKELLEIAQKEIKTLPDSYGKIVRLTGRITTHISAFLGHYYAHISKELQIFAPRENEYITAVWH